MNAPDDLITLAGAARILACHRATVKRYRDRGLLRSWRRAGKRHLVSEGEVRALLEPRKAEQQPLPASKGQLGRAHEKAMARLRATGWDV